MKRKDLEKMLRDNGYELVEHGGRHDKWSNGEKTEFVPRHTEIKEPLAKAIIKRLKLQ